MKRYHILDLKSDSCKVVVATSYVSPLSQVYAIALELKSIGYQGDVIFDLVLSNGFSSNRFLKTDFDGEQLNIGKICVAWEVIETEPGIKGDTASGGSKPATVETGLVVQVPFFVNKGDILVINTSDGKYVSRANH
ncbi:hypothetical protein BTM36_24020 [Herbaspirillum sp. VT-16-41]|nr:hypothetical protein BTM36_24020 [Herbaspirillum sp. VT-16-41]